MRLRRNICILLLIAIVMSNSCQPRKTEPDCFPGKSQQVGSFPTTKSNYLPPSAFLDPGGVDDADRGYAAFMKDFKEPTFLTLYESDDEAYRFVWIRSFDEPITLRIQKSLAKISLTVKRSVGEGGFKHGGLIVDQSKDISILAWMKFKSLLEKECFWMMETGDREFGIDGATWLLEGRRENRYHFVCKWSPTKGKFREACLYLLELSKLPINEEDIY
jgi:hypothetical protein